MNCNLWILTIIVSILLGVPWLLGAYRHGKFMEQLWHNIHNPPKPPELPNCAKTKPDDNCGEFVEGH